MTHREYKDIVKQIAEESRIYANDEFERYVAEAGWQDWMDRFVQGEEPTERELKLITQAQLDGWLLGGDRI